MNALDDELSYFLSGDYIEDEPTEEIEDLSTSSKSRERVDNTKHSKSKHKSRSKDDAKDNGLAGKLPDRKARILIVEQILHKRWMFNEPLPIALIRGSHSPDYAPVGDQTALLHEK